MKLLQIVHVEEFDPDTEKAFNKYVLARFAPLLPPTMIVGILIVVALQFWNQTIDAGALRTTGPIGIALVIFLSICVALTLNPRTHANQRNWLLFCLFLYIGSGIGLAWTLALLPGGPLVGVGALILGTIAAPAIVRGAVRAALVLAVYLSVSVVTLGVLDASNFEIYNVIW